MSANNVLRTIIVDDEPLALNLLKSYLNRLPNIEVVAECVNGKTAIEKTLQLNPDLLFLDIQMPGVSGFDVIKKLQNEFVPMVVFVTAFDQYALDAFDVSAVDYLLKPLDEELLKRAISRCSERLQLQPQRNTNKQNYLKAMEQVNAQSDHVLNSGQMEATQDDGNRPKLIIKDRGAITFLEQTEIEWVDAAGDYMCIHSNGETHIVRSTLKKLLSQLDPSLFQRVHRSTIVNLERIAKVIPLAKSEYFLELDGNERIKVSRNYKDVVKNLISEYEKKLGDA